MRCGLSPRAIVGYTECGGIDSLFCSLFVKGLVMSAHTEPGFVIGYLAGQAPRRSKDAPPFEKMLRRRRANDEVRAHRPRRRRPLRRYGIRFRHNRKMMW